MRAGSFLGLLLIAAMGCDQPSATSQRVPGPPQDGAATGDAATAAPQATPAEYGAGSPYAASANSGDAAQQYQPAPPQPGASPYQPSYAPPAQANVPATDAADAASTPVEQPTAQPPAEQPFREKAEAGVGVRGDRIQSGGIYTTPAKAYFQVRERLTFLQVDQALQLFRGLEGRLPQTHEEFMEKVIVANQIQLPELQAGSRYVWDAQKGELMVERRR